jgi:SNF2 family DNA or RNA helicase
VAASRRFGRLARARARVADLLAARAQALPAALPDLARLALSSAARPARLRRLQRSSTTRRPAQPVLPEDLGRTCRGYQRTGVAWLQFLRDAGLDGLLADDMGWARPCRRSARCAYTLVVALSVLFGWAEQAQRFSRRCAAASTTDRGRRSTAAPTSPSRATQFCVWTPRRSRAGLGHGRARRAQAIKNPDSQVARGFALRAGFRLTLTGTPVENRLDELWSQLHFANPGLLGALPDFRERYARPIAAGEPGAAAHLRARIAPFVLRRMKSVVAKELPPRTDAVLHCELDGEERAVYDTVRAASQRQVVERLQQGGSVIEALELLLRLRQAACHRALVPGQSATGSSKLSVLLEYLDEAAAEGHKSLVFSQWTSFLDLVEPHLREAGIAFERLDGSTIDRQGVVERFQSPEGAPVLLISLRAGGTGLNLTAADHVFLLDPWWNPAVEDQAADRAHRIGQDKPVMVYRMVARDTVEERILALQQRKRPWPSRPGQADRAVPPREDLLGLLA